MSNLQIGEKDSKQPNATSDESYKELLSHWEIFKAHLVSAEFQFDEYVPFLSFSREEIIENPEYFFKMLQYMLHDEKIYYRVLAYFLLAAKSEKDHSVGIATGKIVLVKKCSTCGKKLEDDVCEECSKPFQRFLRWFS